MVQYIILPSGDIKVGSSAERKLRQNLEATGAVPTGYVPANALVVAVAPDRLDLLHNLQGGLSFKVIQHY